MPVKLVNTIRTKKGFGEAVAQRFATPKSVASAQGFIRMEVLINEKNHDYDEVKICTNWDTKSDFNAWFTSEEAVNTHKRVAKEEDSPMLGNDVSIYEVKYEHYPAIPAK